jgi:AraC-like DNA-binding protein
MLATHSTSARADTRACHLPIQQRGGDGPPLAMRLWLERDRRLIEGVLEDVAGSLSEPLTLREIGAGRGYSVYQIIRAFRRMLGTTPHAYIMRMRLSHAAERLAQGDTLAGAAADAGFADQSHMTRHFKRIFGTTPLQYLREMAPT